MRSLTARLSKPISEDLFRRQWNEEQQGPPVDFQFLADEVRIVYSDEPSQWSADSLRQVFQIVVHRVDGKCEVEWLG